MQQDIVQHYHTLKAGIIDDMAWKMLSKLKEIYKETSQFLDIG